MKLIVGLGNVGKKYDNTRHNVGFELMDRLVSEWSLGENEFKESKKFECFLAEIDTPERILLVKPTTYMNLSGKSVSKLVKYYDIDIDDVWIIHDDLDISLGSMKIKKGGGHAGHHGVESIINALNNDEFVRFRLGVGKSNDKDVMSKDEGANYVLSSFGKKEVEVMNDVFGLTTESLECCMKMGLSECMNQYNKSKSL